MKSSLAEQRKKIKSVIMTIAAQIYFPECIWHKCDKKNYSSREKKSSNFSVVKEIKNKWKKDWHEMSWEWYLLININPHAYKKLCDGIKKSIISFRDYSIDTLDRDNEINEIFRPCWLRLGHFFLNKCTWERKIFLFNFRTNIFKRRTHSGRSGSIQPIFRTTFPSILCKQHNIFHYQL